MGWGEETTPQRRLSSVSDPVLAALRAGRRASLSGAAVVKRVKKWMPRIAAPEIPVIQEADVAPLKLSANMTHKRRHSRIDALFQQLGRTSGQQIGTPTETKQERRREEAQRAVREEGERTEAQLREGAARQLERRERQEAMRRKIDEEEAAWKASFPHGRRASRSGGAACSVAVPAVVELEGGLPAAAPTALSC